MKKTGIIAIGIVAIVLIFLAYGLQSEKGNEKYLRLHIRAMSDSSEDQAVKLKVRDAVVNFLTPSLAETKDKQSAIVMLNSKLSEIKSLTDKVLKDNGFTYSCRVYVNRELFPTREYEDLTLERGVYDALIIELGNGAGQNWWCVVYPPLCFVNFENTNSSNLKYQSKLKEIIDKFFK